MQTRVPSSTKSSQQPVTTLQQKQQSSPTNVATALVQPKNDSTNATDDYKNNLKELSSYYEREVKRIANENSQLRELYTEGLIARVELEASDKALAEARAQIEVVRQQIAEAEVAVKSGTVAGGDAVRPAAQVWTTGDNKIDNLIRDYGNLYGVDSYLIFCLISQESSFKSSAISPKGAQGLMQLMPATAARYGVTNAYDAAQSIMGGTRYLKDLLQLFNGRIDLALAGYNAGENAVIKYGYRIPPYAETRAYVRLISARYAKKNGVVLTAKT
jgi:soluble lytic murein transglycosylase-like protein